MKKRIISLLLILVIVALSFVSCVRYESTVKVSSEGLFDVSVVFAVKEELLDASTDIPEGVLLTEEKKAELSEEGWHYSDYLSDGYRGYRVSKRNVPLTDYPGEAPEIFDVGNVNLFRKEGATYVFRMKGLSGENRDSLTLMDASGAKLSVSLSLPDKAINHNATTVSEDSCTYTWDLLEVEEGEELFCEFEISMGMGLMIYLFAGGGVILAAAVLVLVVKIRDRKAKKVRKS